MRTVSTISRGPETEQKGQAVIDLLLIALARLDLDLGGHRQLQILDAIDFHAAASGFSYRFCW